MPLKTLLTSLLLSQAPVAPDAPVAAPAVEVPAPAQSVPASALPLLSFEEALAQAEAQNPSLEAARARLRQADTLSRKAWSGYLPNITASGGYTRNSDEASLSIFQSYIVRDTGAPSGPPNDPGREPGPDNPPGAPTNLIAVPVNPLEVPIQKKDQLAGRVAVSQALIVPSLWPAIQNAYLGERVAELTVENARRELLFGVARAYLGAASLRESVAVQEELLKVRQDFERDAETRFQIGDVAKIAVLSARLDRTRAEQDLVRSRNAYASAKSSLAALLARPVDFDVARPEGMAFAVPAPADAASAESTALEQRRDLAAARTQVELAQGQRRGVGARYLPSLVATGNYNLSNAGGFTGQNDSWSLGLGLSWTLFDGGLREAELTEASERIAEAKATLRGAEEQVRDEVRRARLDLESAEANRVKAEEQVTVARESAQLARSNFEAGVATYIEVSNANANLAGAELSAVAESLNVRLARLALARAAGLFDPTRSEPQANVVPAAALPRGR